ncbi:hypothetical protein GDO81_004260 [Engystomops pustulosus]|uniref:Uncharacterized protein n=1 Tax=Engystomops pustulosus TaxID=76066 RepID=A0AAV6ZR44_ENGPU|nr:hypothetical protein GDO81_004260 [Engystomops pustulosus]
MKWINGHHHISEIVEEAFKESELVAILYKVLRDESMGPEVKYNSMGLLCSLMDSDDLRKEMEVLNLKETWRSFVDTAAAM